MIRLPELDLPASSSTWLERWQAQVNAAGDYPEQVGAAKRLFSQKNKRENQTFNTVKRRLAEMCSGAHRCCYCEDSAADEVEHIKPKDLYPEEVFRWENYLYACGPCNGPKNNKFAVFAESDGRFLDVTRAKGAPVEPPASGDPVLINPRFEDPFRFLDLNLESGMFLPSEELTAREGRRAEYTIDEALNLNRDVLREARIEAFDSYRARLREYIEERDADVPKVRLTRLIAALKRMQHPTVWAEMKRQHQWIQELRELFERAPEALDW